MCTRRGPLAFCQGSWTCQQQCTTLSYRMQVNGFKAGIQWKFLVSSYENIRKFSSDLKGTIDLLICDEGHRLKSKTLNSTMKALLEIGCQRRIILTGTPCQNNLLECESSSFMNEVGLHHDSNSTVHLRPGHVGTGSELAECPCLCRFYSMMSFVNPGVLGPPAVFQRVFVKPIEASQDTSATKEEIDSGAARARELQRRISPFMLRRTAAVNEKYLPKCFQYVVFCRPTAAQLSAYKRELYGEEACGSGHTNSALRRLFDGLHVDGSRVLSLINRMRQICNNAKFAQDVCIPSFLSAPSDFPHLKGAKAHSLSAVIFKPHGLSTHVLASLAHKTSELDFQLF
jgi:SNF2 family DNA or RNA helicase